MQGEFYSRGYSFRYSIMISALEWIPAGVADPNPKKYEFSAAEMELIAMMEKQNFDDSQVEEAQMEVKKKKKKESKKIEHNLPADLRMDEYSSDEDDNDAVQGAAIGRLLVEDVEEDMDEEGKELQEDNESDKDGTDSDNDSDDELDDVPDTREYTPIDVEGLNSLGLSQVGTNAPAYMDEPENGEEDDGSEAEDVKIKADDALVVVAKTEEVSANCIDNLAGLCLFISNAR